ncbi:hypothetical protein B0H12DRAFT_1330396 [Mycena haematopus]|nr:hypothetical protein B0H12DRAFT_1330396 [Mycena haematopus]
MRLFKTLFSALFGTGKENPPHTMDPSRTIRAVIEHQEYKGRISSWATDLCGTDCASVKRRLMDLDATYIQSISHYRQIGSIAHECIVVQIQAGEDKGVARLERFKEVTQLGTSQDRLTRVKHEASGHETGNHDNITISDKLHNIINIAKEEGGSVSEYLLVRTVAIPLGSMNIVDVAALALTIGETAQDYSLFTHMCRWWAAMFFQAACLHPGVLPTSGTKGPAFDSAGKIVGIPFIAELKTS